MEYYNQMNFLKIALVYSDILTTVSPTYAQEIKISPEFGRGMEGILNARGEAVRGILNGIDYDEWNPTTDTIIAAKFSPKDILGKTICKTDLQNSVGLPRREKSVLFGVVSRLDPQKGFDLVSAAIPQIIKRDVQIVILGVGDKEIQEELSRLAETYPNKISLHLKFDNNLAHKIYAGADAFLMPSRFEPCGLGQMIALAYGTVPIVNRTGGLADTIVNFSAEGSAVKGNGFVMKEASAPALVETIELALSVHNNETRWKQLLNNAFKSRFSWQESTKLYRKLYQSHLGE
jgi:starch synthase